MPFTNLIPDMTSDTTPSGVASIDSGNAAWYAMDRNSSTQWISSNSQPNYWIQYQFESATMCNAYSITVGTGSNTSPKTWELQGSNTGAFAGEETTLDTQTNITWTASEKKTFYTSNVISYIYYRVAISVSNSFNCGMEELELALSIADTYTAITGSATITAYAEDATGPNIAVTGTANIAVTGRNKVQRGGCSVSGSASISVTAGAREIYNSFLFVQSIELSQISKTFNFVEKIEQLGTATMIKRVNV